MPTCPKCTGHYGGRVPVKDDNGKIVFTNRWRCHCDVNGGSLSIWEQDANGEVVMKPKERWPAKPCGHVFEITEDE